ncbi:S1C family serine protease [Prosthecomicrobium sp. N25]|uniref:S1C family serine protease n=1 Tax=Prosthecomicrobium sp. N25 TaxID=3129254 RepID=UPI00307761AE
MDRFTRWTVVVLLVVLTALTAEPYVARWLYSAEQPRPVTPAAELGAGERAAIELFQKVSPSVVHVFAEAATSFAPAEGGGRSASGTGFVWDAAGHIVTNNHVVENARRVRIRFSSGEIVDAEVVGLAPDNDLAVLAPGRVSTPPPPLAVGSSTGLKVGQSVYAIGNPFGLDQTLTTGIVSALQRQLPTDGGAELTDVIQTDAAINPGNSGGPLLDSSGRLIGVNTAIFSPSGASAGIGFAIPVDTVNRIVPELIRTGRAPTPGIGIVVGDEAVAARLGIAGLVVVRTQPGSPAERAGLRGIDEATGSLGDIIVAAEGRPVRRLQDLRRVMTSVGIGGSMTLVVERNGRRFEVQVIVRDVASGRR